MKALFFTGKETNVSTQNSDVQAWMNHIIKNLSPSTEDMVAV